MLRTLAIISLAALVSCDKKAPPPLFWDFSGAHTAQQVPWPQNRGPNDDFYILEPEGRVKIKVDGTNSFDEAVAEVTFCRFGTELQFIELTMGPMPQGQAYASATKLAQQWGMRTDWIDAWKLSAKGSSDASTAVALNRATDPVTSIEILKFPPDEQAPYRVVFSINWAIPRFSATRPTTQKD